MQVGSHLSEALGRFLDLTSDEMKLTAGNLANVGTAGFQAGRASFQGLLAQADDALPSQVGGAVNGYSMLMGAGINQAQGHITPTGNPLDLAIQGSGYFAVRTANGIRYTRDGEFQVNDAGVLETKDGQPVLDAKSGIITVPSGDVKVGADGTLSVTSPQGNAIVGRVAVMDLGASGASQGESASLYEAAEGATPVVSTSAHVQQGAVESANIDAMQGTVQLLSIQREAEMMQRALSVFHNDLDKTASEELARV